METYKKVIMGISKGVFLVPICRNLGYSASMILRNTLRNPSDPLSEEKRKGIKFTAFALDSSGNQVSHSEISDIIPFDSYFEFKTKATNAELLVGITEINTDGNVWFEQEHEILFQHKSTMARPAIIYDQQPFRQIEKYAPIILLNHKSYISTKIRAVLMFSNFRGLPSPITDAQTMELSYFHCSGRLLKRKSYEITYNSVHYFDIREELKKIVTLSEIPELITVTARGGNSIFAIQTGVINDTTQNMAVEHSLAPPYFVSQNMNEVRARALIFQDTK